MDVRPGGKWSMVMHAQGGEIHWNGEYLEVEEPGRLVFTVSDQPDQDLFDTCTVVLTEIDSTRRRCSSNRAADTCPPRATGARPRAGPASSTASPSGSPSDESTPARPSSPPASIEQEETMGKVVVTEFITLDGVIQDPGGSGEMERGGWSFEYDRGTDGDKFKLDELTASDAQLLGRITYQGFAEAWPTMEDEHGFADKMNSMPKYVVSTTITDRSGRTRR
jgi:hypothetical protein